MTGVWVLLAVVVVVAVLALVRRAVDGRFRAAPAPVAAPGSQPVAREVLTSDEIGAPLGELLTLVQFSSSFCSPCRATRVLLTDVVRQHEGVAHVEVDAESNLDLVRRLHVLRTPTVIVVDPAGVVVGRASGLPRRDQVEATVAAATGS